MIRVHSVSIGPSQLVRVNSNQYLTSGATAEPNTYILSDFRQLSVAQTETLTHACQNGFLEIALPTDTSVLTPLENSTRQIITLSFS